ncbi:MAG TPA: polymer-forming cytoskeletal protein [candidate division Zixibacteria bacterium]|nr:polymer-forming cytoskeletal protein [candidate division Zixibacteria bacterium]
MYRTCLAILALGWLSAVTVPAQDSVETFIDTTETFEFLTTDSIFNEIQLNGNNVTAYDTSGRQWHYDFEFEEWYVGPPDRAQTSTIQDGEQHDGDDGPEAVEERCTERREVDLFSKTPVTIAYDEYVDEDIEVFGRVTVKGWAKGDVISHQKRVLVTKTGRVDGDVYAPEVVIQEGGQVLGTILETDSPLEFSDLKVPFSASGLIVAISLSVFILLLSFLMVSLTPRLTMNIHDCINHNRVKTFFLGLFILIMAPVILIITLVGILLLPLLPFAYIAAIVAGAVSFGINFGNYLTHRFGLGERSLVYRALIGVLAVMLLWNIVALLLGSSSSFLHGLGIFGLVLAILISIYPTLTGIGALALTRFGHRPHIGSQPSRYHPAPPPAPPPIPEPPPTSDRNGESNSETSSEQNRIYSQKKATNNKERDND